MQQMASKFNTIINNGILWILFASSLIVGVIYFTCLEVDELIHEEKQSLTHRSHFIAGYIDSCERVAVAMSRTVQNTYQNSLGASLPATFFNYLHDYPTYNVFGISGFSKDGGLDRLSATLTVQGDKTRLDRDLTREIIAALSLDGQIGTQTSNNSDFVWAYYTSNKHFLFLAPKVAIDDFQFTTDLYKKEYWTLAHPDANPTHKTIITPLYEDAGGKGLMVTISSPVVANNIFLGIASVDIGINTLSELLSIDSRPIGKSLLLDSSGNIIAKNSITELGESLGFDINLSSDKPFKHDGHWWLFKQIAHSELVLGHKINIQDSYITATKQISTIWILILLPIGLFFVLLKLKKALVTITDIADIDQLSSLLNRRGFLDRVEHIFAQTNRADVPLVMLMIDIDHFKNFNDEFGHHTGDQIIISLANVLENNVRASDLVCRWGGEEFVVLLYNTRLAEAIILADQYREDIALTVSSPSKKPITVSIGIAEALPEDSIEEVLEKSDRRLYFAKHTGRNRVCAKANL